MTRLKLLQIIGVVCTCLTMASLPGCEQKKDVLDVEAPGVDIDVDESSDGVEVDINSDSTTE